MLSLIISAFGSISKSLNDWADSDSELPIATLFLVIACIAVYFLGIPNSTLGLRYTDLWDKPWIAITSIFAHGSFSHLYGNMTYFILGSYFVERAFGSKKLLSLFLLGGIFSGLVFACNYPLARLIGASGAVSAVFGALPFSFKKRPMYLLSMFILAGYTFNNIYALAQSMLLPSSTAHLAHLAGVFYGITWAARQGSKIHLV